MRYLDEKGRVAVLYSPGHGSGWYSWCPQYPELLYDKAVIEWVDQGKPSFLAGDMKAYVERTYPDLYVGRNLLKLEIMWLKPGTKFRITEYVGSESVELLDNIVWQTA